MTPPSPDGDQPPPAAIALSGVSAGWRGSDDAVIDVSLRLAPGATAVVHGPAGAGKSALLHVLRAAMAPRTGEVWLLGSQVAALPSPVRRRLRRRIGYIAQTPALPAGATVAQAMAQPLAITGRLAARRDLSDLLAYLGLPALLDARVETLSGGQARLVAIARAFVAQPDIVLADEPLAGLDGDGAARIVRLLSEVARQRAAVVVTTQTPDAFAGLPAERRSIERGRLAEPAL